jgi:inward rectifier potassium channel
MQQPKFDPGLTQQYAGQLRRAINPDGSFNVRRRGSDWRDFHPYLHLVELPWYKFFGLILLAYFLVNAIFACLYFMLGPTALQGAIPVGTVADRFWQGVYFSSQTLTTVGYGAIYPSNGPANAVAGLEAFLGLLGFAVATGLLFGRIARPSARIGFSPKALIAPYQDGTSLQFRVVNRRTNNLIELEATVVLMRVSQQDGELQRSFDLLKLERSKVLFFSLTWTVVHPIDSESPLYGKTAEDLAAMQIEVLVMIKAWDETFSQNVFQRYSYTFREITWDAKFTQAFTVDQDGSLSLEVNRVGDYRAVNNL